MVYPRTVTRPSTNWARRKATTLTKTNALPLSEAATTTTTITTTMICQSVALFCRKYLRDVDRMQLSQLAFIHCLDALQEKTTEQCVTAEAAASSGTDEDDRLHRLLLTYQVRQYAVKMQTSHADSADKLLMAAYHKYIDVEVVSSMSVYFI